MTDVTRLVVLAPNWLGDAVMALPAIADVRRAFPRARLSTAARPPVADLLHFIPGVDEVVSFAPSGGAGGDATALVGRFDVALLLPNSFRAAWTVWRAGIAGRWGYRGDGRSWLLTRAIAKPSSAAHQAEYYQRLTAALDIPAGPREARVDVPAGTRARAGDLLKAHGYNGHAPIVVFAPGAAYGTAKQWIPSHVAALIGTLARERESVCVLVGGREDASAGERIRGALTPGTSARVIDLIGQTTVEMLIGVLALADACVSNDSGAMHLAAAIGTPVVAIFGPTNERQTSPLVHAGSRAIVLTNPVWCRPCMLRECPIDHSCMTGITPERVFESVASLLNA